MAASPSHRLAAIALLSLLLVAGTALLWLRSHGLANDKITCTFLGTRYTLRSNAGRITLLAPPTDGPAADLQAREWAAQLSNDRLVWQGHTLSDAEREVWIFPIPNFERELGERPRQELQQLPRSAALRALLQAIEDPHRFAAAHHLLSIMHRENFSESHQVGEKWRMRYNGLEAELRPILPEPEVELSESGHDPRRGLKDIQGFSCQGEPALRFPADQIPRLAAHWHARLAIPLISIPHSLILLLLLFPPAFWCFLRWRRAWFIRLGLCHHCGYDLRHTPQRCPECGQPSPAHSVKDGNTPFHIPHPTVARIKSHWFSTLSISSLILATAFSALWLHSHIAAAPGTLSWYRPDGRHTLRIDRGRIVLLKPPPAGDPAQILKEVERAEWWARKLTNDGILWRVRMVQREVDFEALDHLATIDDYSPPARALARIGDGASQVLLRALDDPNTFVATHVLLTRRYLGQNSGSMQQDGDTVFVHLNGLDVELRPALAPHPPTPHRDEPGVFNVDCQGQPSVRIDSAQLPAIRQQWRACLDLQVLSIPIAAPTLLFLLPPAFWAFRRARRVCQHLEPSTTQPKRRAAFTAAISRAHAVLSLLCLLCAAGTIVLWTFSHHTSTPFRHIWNTPEGRYTLRSEAGRIILTGPPPVWPLIAADRAADWARQLSNADVAWSIDAASQTAPPSAYIIVDSGGRPARELVRMNAAVIQRPLLEAIKDPNRFAAAHLVLTNRYRSALRVPGPGWDGEGIIVSHNRLLAEIHPPSDGRSHYGISSGDESHVRFDPAQPLSPIHH